MVDSNVMVNGSLPCALQGRAYASGSRLAGAPSNTPMAIIKIAAFVQFLGKFYFFDLRENLRIILFDYAQKRRDAANVVFKPAC